MLLSNFHFHETTTYTFRCEDRGLRARFTVNLQWNRHKKTYLGDQLIAFLIIMAVVYQNSNRRKCNFHFHECTSYTFVKTEDSELDLMWICKGIDIKRHYISTTRFVLKSCIVAVANFGVFVVVDFLLVNNRFLLILVHYHTLPAQKQRNSNSIPVRQKNHKLNSISVKYCMLCNFHFNGHNSGSPLQDSNVRTTLHRIINSSKGN